MSNESLYSITVLKRSSGSTEIKRTQSNPQAQSRSDESLNPRYPALEPCCRTSKEFLKDVSCIILNVASAVGVVVANKMVFSVYGFRFGTLLTTIHFVATSLYLYGMKRMDLLRPKPIPLSGVVLLSLSFCGFVVLTNLSLQYNSVGFYQMAKVLTTPGVALIQFFFHGIRFRGSVMASLAVTCVGVMITTFTDITFNVKGMIIALAGVVVTSFYQVVCLLGDSILIVYYKVGW